MKKFLTGIVVLSLASMAFAVPVFDINGGVAGEIDILNPTPLVLPVNVTGATGAGGILLNLQTSGPFEITSLVVDGTTIFAGKMPAEGANIIIGSSTGEFNDMAMASLAATSTIAAASDAGKVAWITIGLAPGAKLNDVGTLWTGNVLGDSAMLTAGGDQIPSTQGQINLSVVPEPVSALLLLAGLPLIRRRRA